MEKDFTPDSLDVPAFARSGARLEAVDPLARYPRLVEDITGAPEGHSVQWLATGEWRDATGTVGVPWLALSGDAVLPMTCQRCLQPVEMPVAFETRFRFVADEATADAEDDESEEDLLVIRRDLPLRELVEDELLLAMPPVPLHEACPVALPTSVEDPDFAAAEEARAHPFAVLAGLNKGKLG
ncbi:YceD family protein [Xylophilus sp. GOD-11R]|uniref:YceD family protein n=1 Tax=Xylophilus sp. GOD-11R TaxID=3089814 RepID=UPI00298C3A3D|nr:YceD family protein [Xylophilus sp. GOD-11R]WPB56011.1 YceD family protein [Xylophilus sp. GOD-11R]